jgi:cell division septum initiation protein DivIVA
LDNQLKQLNEKTKDLREKRNTLEEKITNYASSNNLSNATAEISDGKLKFVNTKVQEPLSYKYLEKTLSEVIKNESQVKLIMDYIKQKRSAKIVPEIKRFSNN